MWGGETVCALHFDVLWETGWSLGRIGSAFGDQLYMAVNDIPTSVSVPILWAVMIVIRGKIALKRGPSLIRHFAVSVRGRRRPLIVKRDI